MILKITNVDTVQSISPHQALLPACHFLKVKENPERSKNKKKHITQEKIYRYCNTQ
jgi:hypothetical protein